MIGEATVNIADDDDPVVTVYFDLGTYMFGEGETAADVDRGG